MHIKVFLAVLSAFIFTSDAIGQESAAQVSDSVLIYELRFVQHLKRQKHLQEATYALHSLRFQDRFSQYSDTLNFLLAENYLSLKQFDSSSYFFQRVSPASSVHQQSCFFAALASVYTMNYTAAQQSLGQIKPNSPTIQQLWLTEQAGLSLLRRDTSAFSTYAKDFSLSWFVVENQQKTLNELKLEIMAFRPKKPWVAGLLSTAVPGLGKVYAKRYGDAASTFFINLSLGLIALENYRKDGLSDPKTLVFGSIFSLFYIGNIWGSVYSVKMYHDDFNDVINENIRHNMHTPLRVYYQ